MKSPEEMKYQRQANGIGFLVISLRQTRRPRALPFSRTNATQSIGNTEDHKIDISDKQRFTIAA
ncbi:hypothetical protein [Schauerella aestuarii]|uniref:hypothetical protein n=1 Tax=Schauerella aestuarii TaxID=2511204 RepID=UPI001367CB82|nr:hypothetical protein [Achromobacter aestuarii]MYZ43372.1 hypothetical protein [Achromobacter aestuarii]